MPQYKLKNKQINHLRAIYKEEVFKDQQMNQKAVKRIGMQDPFKSRLNFLNKFFMYASIQKSTMTDASFNNSLHN